MARSPQYAKVVPLFRDLDRSPSALETEDERLMKLRYPPTGDPAAWVRHGPDDWSQARNWHWKIIREHEHVADKLGADCSTCGFPWWPDLQDGA